MKKYITSLSLFIGLIVFVQLSACDPDEVSAETRTRQQLTAQSWVLSSAVVDGADKTSVYDGLTLSFDDASFTTENGNGVWPASGTWDLQEGTSDVIVRSDGVEVKILTLTSNVLEISFDWAETTYGPGRSKSVSGSHTLVFNAQ